MSDNDRVESLLERFGVKKASDGSAEATVHEIKRKKPYRAAEISQSEQRLFRFKIYFSNGDVSAPSYSYMANVFVKGDNYMGIVLSVGGVEIRGRNLSKILDSFCDERVLSLRSFDPNQYDPPASDEPLIESIVKLDSK